MPRTRKSPSQNAINSETEPCNAVATTAAAPPEGRERVVAFVKALLATKDAVLIQFVYDALQGVGHPVKTEAATVQLLRMESMSRSLFVASQVGLGCLVADEVDGFAAANREKTIKRWAKRLSRGSRTVRQMAATYRRVRDGRENLDELVKSAEQGWKALTRKLAVPREEPAAAEQPKATSTVKADAGLSVENPVERASAPEAAEKLVTVSLWYGCDVLAALRGMKADSVDCVVTSPPYFRQRDYGVDGQGGLESTLDEHIAWLVAVFQEVRPVLKPTGTLWINYADTTAAEGWKEGSLMNPGRGDTRNLGVPEGSLLGLQERLVLGLIADGWTLRNRCAWLKRGRMRPWMSRLDYCWEPVYLFTRTAENYFTRDRALQRAGDAWDGILADRNRNGHPAPFPPELPERCVLLGCPEGGLVLDPFSGSGSTGVAAVRNGRSYVGIDLNEKYLPAAEARIRKTRAPGGGRPILLDTIDELIGSAK